MMSSYGVSNSLSSTIGSISSWSTVDLNENMPKVKINETGNRIYIDFGRESQSWIYGDSDVEIGLSGSLRVSYIAIEFKKKLSYEEQEDLREAIENERIYCHTARTRSVYSGDSRIKIKSRHRGA